jgi:diacylglycerol kinase family enzyme
MKAPAGQRPRLGIVPLGSGNDFASSFGVDPDPPMALREIFTGSPRLIDIARLTDNLGREEYCDNTIGIGFDATVTIRSRKFKKARGFFVYFLAVLQTIILNHEAALLRIETDEERLTGQYLMFVICNGGMEGGGFRVAPDARLDDGVLNYASVMKISRLMMFRLLPEVIKGTHGRFKAVRLGHLKKITIVADRPLYIHTDGEIFSGFGMDVRELSLEILPAALEVMGKSKQAPTPS